MAVKFQSSGQSGKYTGRKSAYQLAVEEVQADIFNQSKRALDAVKKGKVVPLGMEEVSDTVARNKLRSGSPEDRGTFLQDMAVTPPLIYLLPGWKSLVSGPYHLATTEVWRNGTSY